MAGKLKRRYMMQPSGCIPVMEAAELVKVEDNCPRCGERRMDCLVWMDDTSVICASCGTMFTPESAEG